MLKRAFDLLLAILGLIILAPLFMAIALMIRIESSGPIIFKQERVGRRGRSFTIYKFRTMKSDAERLGPRITVHGDNRITRFGAVLRRYKLDELPQLFNVLLGEMSFVGPRPEVPEYIVYYPEESRERILSILPGITDIATLEFSNEEVMLSDSENPLTTYVSEILPRKLKLYHEYIEQRSFCFDLRILCKTILTVFWR